MSPWVARGLKLNTARLFALGLAFLVNLAVFCAAPWLISTEMKLPKVLDSPFLSYLPLNTTPPLEEEPPPPPPEPQPPVFRMDLNPEPVVTPPQTDPAPPRLDIDFNTSLTSGPKLPALPALPVAPKNPAPSRAIPKGRGLLLDRQPMIAARVPPPYPYMARRRGIQGKVMVRLLVGSDGRVKKSEVIKAEPSGVFEEAVLRTVGRWRFSPALSNGKPITSWVETTVKFELK